MAAFPFTEEIDHLYQHMDEIPVDGDVRFAQAFMELLSKTNGNPWGPQASDRSKLATRLWFAGWTRAQLEQVGLKPKDVENFRRTHGLTAGEAGRPKSSTHPALLGAFRKHYERGTAPESGVDKSQTIAVVEARIRTLNETISACERQIQIATSTISAAKAELEHWEATLKGVSR